MNGSVVSCPPTLRIGCNILLRLRVWLLPAAFELLQQPFGENGNASISEGQESIHEQLLRCRKTSLRAMFKLLGLMPRSTAPVPERPQRTCRTEVVRDVSDQEEAEAEGEELSEKDLNMIYRKCAEDVSTTFADRHTQSPVAGHMHG